MSAARQTSATDPEERASELRREIEHHSYRYHVLDDPEIGDDVYDASVRTQLKRLRDRLIERKSHAQV